MERPELRPLKDILSKDALKNANEEKVSLDGDINMYTETIDGSGFVLTFDRIPELSKHRTPCISYQSGFTMKYRLRTQRDMPIVVGTRNEWGNQEIDI